LRIHLGELEHKPLTQIARNELREMVYQKLKSGLSPKTVNNIKAILSAILNHAREDGLIQANPSIKLGKYIKRKDPKKTGNDLFFENKIAQNEKDTPDKESNKAV
jgi:hypothetical protein